MEINILEQKKNRLVFELKGADHTFCNALKEELWNDPDIENVGYAIEHPLVGIPRIVVETKEGTSPKEVIANSVKRLRKLGEKFKTDIVKELDS